MLATQAKTRYERDRRGIPLTYGRMQIDQARNGKNIYLTIHEQIQNIVEEELDELYQEFKPRAAYAIMVDPFSGNILAMAQRPTFNPNDRRKMDPNAWRNRMIADIFEPGSTMKPFAVAGALDYRLVTPLTRFDCEKGYWMFAGKPLRDAHYYGNLTVTEIIQKSSNIGTAKIAIEMGKPRLYQTLRRFGFGEKTGIPIQPESVGIFRQPRKWDSLSISRFPIGQGIAVSPLQLVRAYCALANGGHLIKLRLIDRVSDPDTGEISREPGETAPRAYLRRETHQQVLNMLKLVTQEGGTATRAAVKGYDVAGKTGTSQKVIDGQYSQTKYFATFIGFVPADNPSFVLLVTADEPQGSYYGGVVAAPTFRRISQKALSFLNVPPKYPVSEEEFNAQFAEFH